MPEHVNATDDEVLANQLWGQDKYWDDELGQYVPSDGKYDHRSVKEKKSDAAQAKRDAKKEASDAAEAKKDAVVPVSQEYSSNVGDETDEERYDREHDSLQQDGFPVREQQVDELPPTVEDEDKTPKVPFPSLSDGSVPTWS